MPVGTLEDYYNNLLKHDTEDNVVSYLRGKGYSSDDFDLPFDQAMEKAKGRLASRDAMVATYPTTMDAVKVPKPRVRQPTPPALPQPVSLPTSAGETTHSREVPKVQEDALTFNPVEMGQGLVEGLGETFTRARKGTPAQTTGDVLGKVGESIAQTTKAGQQAQRVENIQRSTEHPAWNLLTDIGETVAAVPQVAYQFLPQPNETPEQTRARMKQLGQGVVEGALGGTLETVADPVGTFAVRPFSTALNVVPFLGAAVTGAKALGKAAKAAKAVPEAPHLRAQSVLDAAERRGTYEKDVARIQGEEARVAGEYASAVGTGEQTFTTGKKAAAEELQANKDAVVRAAQERRAAATAELDELRNQLPAAPLPVLDYDVAAARKVIDDYTSRSQPLSDFQRLLDKVDVPVEHARRFWAGFQRAVNDPHVQPNAVASALVDDLVRGTRSSMTGMEKHVERLVDDAIKNPTVGIRQATATVEPEVVAARTVPPATAVARPGKSPRTEDLWQRGAGGTHALVAEALEPLATLGDAADIDVRVRASDVASKLNGAVLAVLDDKLKAGALLTDKAFVKALAAQVPDKNAFTQLWSALKGDLPNGLREFSWSWYDATGAAHPVDVAKVVDGYVKTPQGKDALRTAASAVVRDTVDAAGREILTDRVNTLSGNQIAVLADADTIMDFTAKDWRKFIDGFIALPAGHTKAEAVASLRDLAAARDMPPIGQHYANLLADKVNRFVPAEHRIGETLVDPAFKDVLKWEETVRNAPDVNPTIAGVNQQISKNLTSRNLPTHLNNFASNFALQSLRRGNPLAVASELVNTVAGYNDYTKAGGGLFKDLTPDQKLYRALEDVGIADRDVLHDAGVSKVAGLKQADWLYKQGDNIFKLAEGVRNMRALFDDIGKLREGESLAAPLSGNRGVRLTKQGDHIAVQVVTPAGDMISGTAKKLVRAGSQELYKVVAQAAAKPAFDLFFDYTDLPNVARYLKRAAEAVPLVGGISPFLSWSWKSLDLPGKKGLGWRVFEPFTVTSDSPAVLAAQAKRLAAVGTQRTLVNNALHQALLPTNDPASKGITALYDYIPNEQKYAMLATLTGDRLGYLPLGNFNFMQPTEKALRMLMTATAPTDQYAPLLERQMTGKSMSPEEKKLLGYLHKVETGQVGNLWDIPKVIGLTGGPMTDVLDNLELRARQGKELTAKDFAALGPAVFTGTGWRIIDSIAAIPASQGIDVPSTLKDEPLAWFIGKRLTSVGWSPKDVQAEMDGGYVLRKRAQAAEHALRASPKHIDDLRVLQERSRKAGDSLRVEALQGAIERAQTLQTAIRAHANTEHQRLSELAARMRLTVKTQTPFPGVDEPTPPAPPPPPPPPPTLPSTVDEEVY